MGPEKTFQAKLCVSRSIVVKFAPRRPQKNCGRDVTETAALAAPSQKNSHTADLTFFVTKSFRDPANISKIKNLTCSDPFKSETFFEGLRPILAKGEFSFAKIPIFHPL